MRGFACAAHAYVTYADYGQVESSALEAAVVECLVSEEDNKLVAEIYPDEEFRAAQSDIQAYFNEQIDQLNDTLPPYKAIAKVVIRDTEFVKTTTKKIKRTYKK